MKYDEIDPSVRTYFGAHEGLRKLGFAADDIFLELASNRIDGKLSAFATLRTQGIEYRMFIAPIENGDSDAFVEKYKRAVDALRDGKVSQADLDKMWGESACHVHSTEFILSLQAKGLKIHKVSG